MLNGQPGVSVCAYLCPIPRAVLSRPNSPFRCCRPPEHSCADRVSQPDARVRQAPVCTECSRGPPAPCGPPHISLLFVSPREEDPRVRREHTHTRVVSGRGSGGDRGSEGLPSAGSARSGRPRCPFTMEGTCDHCALQGRWRPVTLLQLDERLPLLHHYPCCNSTASPARTLCHSATQHSGGKALLWPPKFSLFPILVTTF